MITCLVVSEKVTMLYGLETSASCPGLLSAANQQQMRGDSVGLGGEEGLSPALTKVISFKFIIMRIK